LCKPFSGDRYLAQDDLLTLHGRRDMLTGLSPFTSRGHDHARFNTARRKYDKLKHLFPLQGMGEVQDRVLFG
jgi:hypothetical protein